MNYQLEAKSQLIYDGCPELVPEMSIMIPTFKRPSTLKTAIDSCVKQNTSISFEVVIVDNDDQAEFEVEINHLVECYSQFNIRYFRNTKNIGMFGNWNRCISLARAKWLTILNDDDCLLPNFLEVSNYYRYTESMIITDFYNVNSEEKISELIEECSDFSPSYQGQTQNKPAKKLNYSDIFWRNPINGSLGAVFEKEKAEYIGGYNLDNYPNSDYYFTFLYWKHYGISRIPKKLTVYRWGENESLKVETLVGFFRNDFKLRNEMLDDIFESESILKTFYFKVSQMIALRSLAGYYKVNELIPTEQLIDEISVSPKLKPKFLSSPMISVALKGCVKLLDLYYKVK